MVSKMPQKLKKLVAVSLYTVTKNIRPAHQPTGGFWKIFNESLKMQKRYVPLLKGLNTGY